MNVKLSLKTVRELNTILGMLESPDPETKKLGFGLLEQNDFVNKVLWSFYYKTKSGKEIPVSWYFRKSKSLLETEDGSWVEPVASIVRAILLGEPCFSSKVIFHFDMYHTDLETGTNTEELSF